MSEGTHTSDETVLLPPRPIHTPRPATVPTEPEPLSVDLRTVREPGYGCAYDSTNLTTPLPTLLNYALKLDPVPAMNEYSPLAQLGAALLQFYAGVPMSEVYLREALRTVSTRPHIRNLMEVLQEQGCVTEQTYASRPSAEVLRREARGYRIGGYASIPTIFTVEARDAASWETIRATQASLYHNGPALLTTPVYHYGAHPWKSVGEAAAMGGSAFLLVGYNDHEFLLRGAWGARWGPTHDGYTTYPYTQFLRQHHWDVYTVVLRTASPPPSDRCVVS